MAKIKKQDNGIFLMRDEWNGIFQGLPSEQSGKLIKAIYDKHCKNVDPDFGEDNMLNIFFGMIYPTIERADAKRKEKCAKNTANVIRRWNNKNPREDDIPVPVRRRIAYAYRGVPGCYAFIGSNDELFYIGKSDDLAKRIPTSYKERRDAVKIKKIMAYKTRTEEEATFLEAMLIAENKPTLNVVGVDNDVEESCGIDILRDFHVVHVFD
jgi:hypothetical protein